MGITIQAYRSRIGSFMPFKNQPTENYKSEQFGYETYPTNIPSLRKYLYLILLLISPLLFSTLAVHPVSSPAQSYSHPLYPTMPDHSLLQLQRNSTETRSDNTAGAMVVAYILQYGIQMWSPSIASSLYRQIDPSTATRPAWLETPPPLSSSMPSCLYSSSRDNTSPTFWISRKVRNRLVRASNGNRQDRGLKIAHWNAGSAHLRNKMDEVELAVAEHHPHLLGISESNLQRSHDTYKLVGLYAICIIL